MTHTKPSANSVTEVLVRSRRRCCFCFGLHGDLDVKQGQIAHLDRNPHNNDLDNLAFLCLLHHDLYDTKTSQSKGLTIGEARDYRSNLYEHIHDLALKEVIAPPINEISAHEQVEALKFYTGTHRSQSVVFALIDGTKTIEEINSTIPPRDLEWTKQIIEGPLHLGWVRHVPGDYGRLELTLNGQRMLKVLDALSEEVKTSAREKIWNIDTVQADLRNEIFG